MLKQIKNGGAVSRYSSQLLVLTMCYIVMLSLMLTWRMYKKQIHLMLLLVML